MREQRRVRVSKRSEYDCIRFSHFAIEWPNGSEDIEFLSQFSSLLLTLTPLTHHSPILPSLWKMIAFDSPPRCWMTQSLKYDCNSIPLRIFLLLFTLTPLTHHSSKPFNHSEKMIAFDSSPNHSAFSHRKHSWRTKWKSWVGDSPQRRAWPHGWQTKSPPSKRRSLSHFSTHYPFNLLSHCALIFAFILLSFHTHYARILHSFSTHSALILHIVFIFSTPFSNPFSTHSALIVFAFCILHTASQKVIRAKKLRCRNHTLSQKPPFDCCHSLSICC